ncbi:hypothetical protein FRB94_010783 [Tulasnella sp. JGI-2019a]|nr:hypothetical protein FRB93_013902 [Tulasnella sp. JGI-2019a]KAG9010255.1 hypothetical protein FRB94_010783 [Tulasnella sp. JGI-2019a]KAG9035900.1 hypothetical protein FRB95_010303 [Tulasnella sp. JGI-2019a]
MISLLPSPPTPPSSPTKDETWLMKPPSRTPLRKSRSIQEKLARYRSLGVQNAKGMNLIKKRSMLQLRISNPPRTTDIKGPTTPPPFQSPENSPPKARGYPSKTSVDLLIVESVEEALAGHQGVLSLPKNQHLTGSCVDKLKSKMLLGVSGEVHHKLGIRNLKGNPVKNEKQVQQLIHSQCDAWIRRYMMPRTPLAPISTSTPSSFTTGAIRPGWPMVDNSLSPVRLQFSKQNSDVLPPTQACLDTLCIQDDDVWV